MFFSPRLAARRGFRGTRQFEILFFEITATLQITQLERTCFVSSSEFPTFLFRFSRTQCVIFVCRKRNYHIICRCLLFNGVVFLRHVKSMINSVLQLFDITIRGTCMCTHMQFFHANPLHTHSHTQIIAGCFRVVFLRERRDGLARGATSMSTLKRYRNQSIIRNNGFLKTTFHRLPPGGHVVSPHICQF